MSHKLLSKTAYMGSYLDKARASVSNPYIQDDKIDWIFTLTLCSVCAGLAGAIAVTLGLI